MSGIGRRAAASAALTLAAGLVLVAPATADTITPTRFDDPPPNGCKANDCSLREAMKKADNGGDPDTVVLGDGTYELTRPATDTSFNDDGDLYSGTSIIIRGLGPAKSKIDANGLDRAFILFGKATLEGLSIKGGDASDISGPDLGGAIRAITDKLTLRNVLLRKSEASRGGGIAVEAGTVTIKDSTITQNIADEGGGVDVRANLPQPVLKVRSSTISDNSAVKGAGIYANGFSDGDPIAPILQVDNSTVAGNEALGQGAGIFGDNDAIVVVDDSTVAYNMADSNNTGGGVGGGIHQFNNASFQFNDSVLALNTVGSSGSGPACDGDFEDGGSLVDTTGGNPNCDWDGLFLPTFTTNPLIGPLADNGGPTKTIKLLANSPAQGISLGCPGKDQRGKIRPNEDCDAGSYERKKVDIR